MGLFDFLKSKRFEDMLDAELESVLAEPESKDEIYCEIAENYVTLLSLLNVCSYKAFTFPDRGDCRRVAVDGIEYDFDSAFSHGGAATELLAIIDGMMADLGEDMQTILRTVEGMMKDKACL